MGYLRPPVRPWRRSGTRVIKAVTNSGNTEIVAAVADKKIRLLRLTFSTDTAVNVKINEGTSTQLTVLAHLAANGALNIQESDFVETSTANTALNINLSGAVTSGSVQLDYETF